VRVGALVDKPLVVIAQSASLDEAIAMLQSEGVRRLLVIAEEGALAGIVSVDDVLGAIAARMGARASDAPWHRSRIGAARPYQPCAAAACDPRTGTAARLATRASSR